MLALYRGNPATGLGSYVWYSDRVCQVVECLHTHTTWLSGFNMLTKLLRRNFKSLGTESDLMRSNIQATILNKV